MAKHLWAQVYYQEQFAGVLSEESGGRMSFTYDPAYLAAGHPAIAHTLPVQGAPLINPQGLHPFFDNLVSEGWMENAQTRLLGKRQASRFELLISFGVDCVGAVSVVDPEPVKLTQALLDVDDTMSMALMTSRASLSGVQPKLALVAEGNTFRPAKLGELSTHIGKFPSSHHNDLVINEYLTTQAYKALLPYDNTVEFILGEVAGIDQQALIIKRFDRTTEGQRLHFEEFNQLLGKMSQAKYDGAHADMADFIRATPKTLATDIYKLFARILAGILLGNTDMHFKNFAMFHTPNGLRLTPSYDQVAALLYQYKTLALALAGTANLLINKLKPSHIIRLGEEFDLSTAAIKMAVDDLEKNLANAKEAIWTAPLGKQEIKKSLNEIMEKRWNGTFTLIGKTLSKKQ